MMKSLTSKRELFKRKPKQASEPEVIGLPTLDLVEVRGFSTVPNFYMSGTAYKVSDDGEWVLDMSPFSGKYRLTPISSNAKSYNLFMMMPDIFLKNESENVEDLLILKNELLSNS